MDKARKRVTMKIVLRIKQDPETKKWLAYGWKNFEILVSGKNLKYLESEEQHQRWKIEGFEKDGKLFVEKLKREAPIDKIRSLKQTWENFTNI